MAQIILPYVGMRKYIRYRLWNTRDIILINTYNVTYQANPQNKYLHYNNKCEQINDNINSTLCLYCSWSCIDVVTLYRGQKFWLDIVIVGFNFNNRLPLGKVVVVSMNTTRTLWTSGIIHTPHHLFHVTNLSSLYKLSVLNRTHRFVTIFRAFLMPIIRLNV